MDDIFQSCTFCSNAAITFDMWANPCCDCCFNKDNHGIMAGTYVKQAAPWWVEAFKNDDPIEDLDEIMLEISKLEAKYKGIKW